MSPIERSGYSPTISQITEIPNKQVEHFIFKKDQKNFICQAIESVTHSILQSKVTLAKKPYLECFQMAYASTSKKYQIPRFSSSTSFSSWSTAMREKAVQNLIQLKVPLQRVSLHQIYRLIYLYEDEICHQSGVTYPALFRGNAFYRDSKSSFVFKQIPFELEVHSDRKISLLIFQDPSARIDSGDFKVCFKAFPLGKPTKVFTYSYSHSPQNSSPEMLYRTMKKEEKFLTQCSELSTIVKVDQIFYYHLNHQDLYQVQQIITMDYYPYDLFHILQSYQLSDQAIIDYSLKIVEAVLSLHQKGILHRDIKPENILMSLKDQSLKLTDFGLACELSNLEECKSFVGSMGFIAPEGFYSDFIKGTESDVWSIGCIFWLLWTNALYPWYEEAKKKNPSIQKMLNLMFTYEKNPPHQNEKISYLLWNMLRFQTLARWRLPIVFNYLCKMKNELSLQPSFNLPQQFQKELFNQKRRGLKPLLKRSATI